MSNDKPVTTPFEDLGRAIDEIGMILDEDGIPVFKSKEHSKLSKAFYKIEDLYR